VLIARLVISRATLDAEKFPRFFDAAQIFIFPGEALFCFS
jgi:HrpA-like RNA helicase